MVTTVLIVGYLVFLCRGMPDSIIGAAWPMMFGEFAVSEASLSVLTIGISLCTAVASLVSDKLIIRFGTQKVLAVSLLCMALSVLGFSLAGHFWMLIALVIPMGFCAGGIDNTLNNYLATRYKTLFLNMLHGFYGLGAILSPILIAYAINRVGDWRYGFRMAFVVLISVFVVLLLSLPLWKKVEAVYAQKETVKEVSLSIPKQAKMRPVRYAWAIVLLTNAIEYGVGVWGGIFFTEAKSISPDIAANMITVLYAGMTTGRLLSAFLSVKVPCAHLLRGCSLLCAIPCVLLFFSIPVAVWAVVMFLLGLANGPIYPTLISMTPQTYGKTYSQSIIGTEIALAYTGCICTHLLLGILVEWISIGILPVFIVVCYGGMMLALRLHRKAIQ